MRQIREAKHASWQKDRTGRRGGSSPYPAQVAKMQADAAARFNTAQQIRSVRQSLHTKWRETKYGMHRVWTVSDIERLQREQEAGYPSSGSSSTTTTIHSGDDPALIGKEALEHTNLFRLSQHKPSLVWNQALANIGAKHSKDMAEHKVPFSHQGFDGRVRQYPFRYTAAAENLAMNKGFSRIAKVAVEGWVESPGHRKNLLGTFSLCGIGVHRGSDGTWYLTQLFARV
eukprot:TRINITY_DN623_c0_g1_i12.p1 TRINITY_DN623_c0_g1~~TRINITY_DN623_c0_g1_i12.p1  ORF type:complete len:229 (-),score=35.79 TRINITY_DN623_c0_g1_i12:144-830(-)